MKHMTINYEQNAPRWMILVLDLIISTIALLVAYLLRFNFDIPDTEYLLIPIGVTVSLISHGIAFFIFKTYAGIVRHTGFNDFQRVFFAAFSAACFMAGSNLVGFLVNGQYFLPYSIVIITFLLTFFFMAAMRVTVKMIYREIISYHGEKINVVIFGAGESGLNTKRALDKITDKKYNVLYFLDDNDNKVGKRLEGVLIKSGGEAETLLASADVDQLIIAVQNLERERKTEIVEAALAVKTKVLHVPPVQDWIGGEINVKQIKNVKIEDLLGRKAISLEQDKVAGAVKQKVVLITGAAGSIGSGLVRQIAKLYPEKILIFDQAETPLYELEMEVENTYGRNLCEVIVGDIREKERLRNVFKTYKPQLVFHAAAYKHVPLMEANPAEAVKTNVFGTLNLVDLADEFGVDKFVMVSTDKAVNPTNVMGASKRIAEIYAQSKNNVAKNTKYITTRFGNVLGSNGSVIPLFRKQIENGGPLTVTHPEITRFFMTIPEACQLVVEAGIMGEGGEIFIFDMGRPVKIIDLAVKMIKLSGLEPHRDIDIKYSGLRPGEKLYEELLANEENTLKTHHPKIMRAKTRTHDFDEVSKEIKTLIDLYGKQDNSKMVLQMKKIVPEFISKNSVFSKLDQNQS